jgi:hypothetical protein
LPDDTFRTMDVDGGLEEGGAAAPGDLKKRASTEETDGEEVPDVCRL